MIILISLQKCIINNYCIMKTMVLLLVSLMPFALFSQSKSNDVDIKKPMLGEIDRYVVPLQVVTPER